MESSDFLKRCAMTLLEMHVHVPQVSTLPSLVYRSLKHYFINNVDGPIDCARECIKTDKCNIFLMDELTGVCSFITPVYVFLNSNNAVSCILVLCLMQCSDNIFCKLFVVMHGL